MLRLICAPACVNNSVLFVAEEYLLLWMCNRACVSSPIEAHDGASLFWLLETKPLGTFMFKSTCGHMLSLHVGKPLGVERLHIC